jgi:hypothetical protein
MEKQNVLEKIEEKVVFKISRLFFLVLAVISMVVIILGTAYLLYGFSPTEKPSILHEDKISITASEVSTVLNMPLSSKTNEGSNISDDQSQKQEELDKAMFEKYIDTLKILLPEPLYSWGPKGSYEGEGYDRQFVVTDDGVIKKVNSFLETLNGYKEYTHALDQLCSILKGFPEDQRLKPLEVFIDLYKQKKTEYKDAQITADQEYERAVEEKNTAKLQSLIVIGSAISSMAFLAMCLVLFSMQRNIKSMSKNQNSIT